MSEQKQFFNTMLVLALRLTSQQAVTVLHLSND